MISPPRILVRCDESKALDKLLRVENRGSTGEQEADGPPQGLGVNSQLSENKEYSCFENNMYIVNVAYLVNIVFVSICKKKSCHILSSRIYLYSS